MSLPSPKSIGRIMAAQNNRAAQYPLFAIQEDKREYVEPGEDYDERERIDTANKYHLCDPCQKLYDADEEYPMECDSCDEEAFDHWRIESVLAVSQAGIFFTDVAAQLHIDQNSHHYSNPRVYGIAAWRNPEMVSVQQHLIKLAGKELPSHYQ